MIANEKGAGMQKTTATPVSQKPLVPAAIRHQPSVSTPAGDPAMDAGGNSQY